MTEVLRILSPVARTRAFTVPLADDDYDDDAAAAAAAIAANGEPARFSAASEAGTWERGREGGQ